MSDDSSNCMWCIHIRHGDWCAFHGLTLHRLRTCSSFVKNDRKFDYGDLRLKKFIFPVTSGTHSYRRSQLGTDMHLSMYEGSHLFATVEQKNRMKNALKRERFGISRSKADRHRQAARKVYETHPARRGIGGIIFEEFTRLVVLLTGKCRGKTWDYLVPACIHLAYIIQGHDPPDIQEMWYGTKPFNWKTYWQNVEFVIKICEPYLMRTNGNRAYVYHLDGVDAIKRRYDATHEK